jgi:uncharacterized protein (DUF2164 family)
MGDAPAAGAKPPRASEIIERISTEQIKQFFLKEREEETGDLAAGMFLDFILEKLAPEFYNQGVVDSHKYMQDATEDLLSIQR